MPSILSMFALIGLIALTIKLIQLVFRGLHYAYWFCWGVYQTARYGGLPKTHYQLKNGQWHASWAKRK